jgi:farnesyl-diphosphate farnesyltransferase
LQIEQFIESIFPSQRAPIDKTSPASVEEAEKARKEAYEAKWDLIYMTTAVVLTVLVITGLMVRLNRTRSHWKMLTHRRSLLPG